MIISQLILIFLNIGMAKYHAYLIKSERKIKHGLWGGGYVIVCLALAWYFKSWVFFVAACLQRKVFFDLSLNLFRNLPLFYVSTTTTSIIDKWHYQLFGKRSEIYMIIYLLLWILSMTFMLCF